MGDGPGLALAVGVDMGVQHSCLQHPMLHTHIHAHSQSQPRPVAHRPSLTILGRAVLRALVRGSRGGGSRRARRRRWRRRAQQRLRGAADAALGTTEALASRPASEYIVSIGVA